MVELQFFLPEKPEVFAALPKRVADYWHWQATATGLLPYWGRYHWVLQTYLYLREGGVPVTLVDRLPEQGVVITHMDCVDYGFRPPPGLTLVVMLVDREVPHPRAHLHVTHNPLQRLPFGLPCCYMPPWPQIGIVPRDPARGDRFESIGYFGYRNNLHPAIADPAFAEALAAMDLKLECPEPSTWHDFSQVDAVVAIRTLGRADAHLSKPALKLYNAWLAEVPSILGHETAYRAEGRPGTGYLEATSVDELLQAIRTLKENTALRRSIVAWGREQARQYEPPRTVARWKSLIADRLQPLHRAQTGNALRQGWHGLRGSALERLLWRMPGRFGQSAEPSPN
jgi:hypothetical protein